MKVPLWQRGIRTSDTSKAFTSREFRTLNLLKQWSLIVTKPLRVRFRVPWLHLTNMPLSHYWRPYLKEMILSHLEKRTAAIILVSQTEAMGSIMKGKGKTWISKVTRRKLNMISESRIVILPDHIVGRTNWGSKAHQKARIERPSWDHHRPTLTVRADYPTISLPTNLLTLEVSH